MYYKQKRVYSSQEFILELNIKTAKFKIILNYINIDLLKVQNQRRLSTINGPV